jgi:DNA-directed RNA polymerase specialized sigma24 family protein
MRTSARSARLALVPRHAVLDAPAPARVPPAIRSDLRISPPALRSAAAAVHARQVLGACLNELPERYRTALWLSDVEQQTIQDVAAALGITIAMATVRLERARRMLAKAICRLCSQRMQAGPSGPAGSPVTSFCRRHRTKRERW